MGREHFGFDKYKSSNQPIRISSVFSDGQTLEPILSALQYLPHKLHGCSEVSFVQSEENFSEKAKIICYDNTQAGDVGGGGEVVPEIARPAKLVRSPPVEEQVSGMDKQTKSNKQTNKQTKSNKQTNKRTNKQTNKQTHK